MKIRRLSLEFGTPCPIDRTSRTKQRNQRGEKLVARVNLDTNEIKTKDNLPTPIEPGRIRDVHTLSVATHGEKFGINFIGDNNTQTMTPEELLERIRTIFPEEENFPKEIVLNCCYSKSYVNRLKSLINSNELPIEKITYHKYQRTKDGPTEGIIYAKHHASYTVKTSNGKEYNTILETIIINETL